MFTIHHPPPQQHTYSFGNADKPRVNGMRAAQSSAFAVTAELRWGTEGGGRLGRGEGGKGARD